MCGDGVCSMPELGQVIFPRETARMDVQRVFKLHLRLVISELWTPRVKLTQLASNHRTCKT